MKTLNVVLFLDGRPGHEKQSMGIVRSLKHFVAIDVLEVVVRQQGLFNDILNHLIYFCFLLPIINPRTNSNTVLAICQRLK